MTTAARFAAKLVFAAMLGMTCAVLRAAFAEPAAADHAQRPARAAQCYLEIKSVYYGGGDCLFTPLDKMGSFRIEFGKGVSAQVKVKVQTPDNNWPPKMGEVRPWPGTVRATSDGGGDASWSGAHGRDATTISLGIVGNTKTGCWRSRPDTYVCAWDKNLRLYLGRLPAEPRPSLGWAERVGMYARIISSSGLDTEHASITAEKSRDGAIAWCREGEDFSLKCIKDTAENDDLARAKATLHANCKTGTYTDFWGRNLKHLDDDILNLDTNEKLGYSTAAGSGVAQSAFDTLCPKTPGATHQQKPVPAPD